MIDIKAAREKLAAIHTEATKFADDNAEKEISAEDQQKQDARFSEMEKLDRQIRETEKLAKFAYENKDNEPEKVQVSSKSKDQVEFEASEKKTRTSFSFDKSEDRAEFADGLAHWFKTGAMPAEFATVVTTTDSGAFLPKQVVEAVAPTVGNAIREGMAAVGARVSTYGSTATVNAPVILPSAGTDLTEGNDSGGENGGNGATMLKKIALVCFGQTSDQIWFSNLELNSLGHDLLEETIPALIDAKEMRLEEKIMTAIIADSAITQSVSTGGVSGSSLTYDDLNTLNNTPSKRFSKQKVLFLSSSAYSAAVGLTGTDGHPILTPDPQNQSLLRFQGTPVVKSDYLENFADSGDVVGVLISFVGFKLRDEGGNKLVRYSGLPTKVDDVGAEVLGYHAYGYVADAIVKLVAQV